MREMKDEGSLVGRIVQLRHGVGFRENSARKHVAMKGRQFRSKEELGISGQEVWASEDVRKC